MLFIKVSGNHKNLDLKHFSKIVPTPSSIRDRCGWTRSLFFCLRSKLFNKWRHIDPEDVSEVLCSARSQCLSKSKKSSLLFFSDHWADYKLFSSGQTERRRSCKPLALFKRFTSGFCLVFKADAGRGFRFEGALVLLCNLCLCVWLHLLCRWSSSGCFLPALLTDF